jgi:hypothetical protein
MKRELSKEEEEIMEILWKQEKSPPPTPFAIKLLEAIFCLWGFFVLFVLPILAILYCIFYTLRNAGDR